MRAYQTISEDITDNCILIHMILTDDYINLRTVICSYKSLHRFLKQPIYALSIGGLFFSALKGRKTDVEANIYSSQPSVKSGPHECHWYRPCLDYQKGKIFKQGRELHLRPHPCYEYIGRCSCMFCMFMPDRHAIENIK